MNGEHGEGLRRKLLSSWRYGDTGTRGWMFCWVRWVPKCFIQQIVITAGLELCLRDKWGTVPLPCSLQKIKTVTQRPLRCSVVSNADQKPEKGIPVPSGHSNCLRKKPGVRSQLDKLVTEYTGHRKQYEFHRSRVRITYCPAEAKCACDEGIRDGHNIGAGCEVFLLVAR